MIHLGDFPASHTAVCIPFDSFAAATGASSATSNFASSDILIYKDGGTTQRASSAGITVSTSFDSQTGLNMIVIDLSDNTDASFYAAGHEYQVGVADVTIDSQTVRFWAGTFSIERAGGVLALIKGNAIKVDVNTIKTNPVVNGGTITFPTTATLASTTNITAGTVTTATNVTNVSAGGIAAASFAAGAIDATAIATDAIGSAELAAAAANKIADAMLDRDMSTGADSGSTTVRTPRQALRFLRNKWSISGTTLTVTKEDDATSSWTSTVTTTNGADPVTANDPAGP